MICHPYDSDIAGLFEKNMENLKKIRSFHLRLGGGAKHSLVPPLIVLGGMARLTPLDPPLPLSKNLRGRSPRN